MERFQRTRVKKHNRGTTYGSLFPHGKSLDGCGKCLQPNAVTGAPDLS